MSSRSNECIPYYSPGTDVTGHCSADVIGKRFVKISGNRQAGPALNTSPTGGNVTVSHATAAQRIFGVAAYDQVSGKKVPVIRKGIVPVLASGAIAAFAEVEVGANGVAVTKASGVAVGFAITAAADATDAQISLY